MTAERQIPAVWSRLAGGPTAAGTVDPAAAAEVVRFAELTSPALAATLSSGIGVSAEEARRSRLLNRLRRVTGLRWARCAADAGIDVVCIKGLATAHCLYADPDLRAMTDSDLVVRACDYRRLVALFEAHGLEQGKVRARSPWGFVSESVPKVQSRPKPEIFGIGRAPRG